MKLNLQNTAHGLIPMYDDDYEEKKKLKIGQVYSAEIKLVRNIEFHRKYFALINCSWEYQKESVQTGFRTKDNFRKYVEVAAGWYDLFYSPKTHEWVQVPKSISFEKMRAEEFADLYEQVKDVLYSVFLKDISKEEFEQNLFNF